MKTCKKCGEGKPLTEFYTHPLAKDGHLNKCKECVRIYARQRRKSGSTKEAQARADKVRRKRHAQKVQCRSVTKRAVGSGRLSKGPCMICGADHDIEAHHECYHQPLCVVWLCPPCHRTRHAEMQR